MGDVVILPVITKLDCEPERVLVAAQDNLESAVVIGWDKDGDFYFASSLASGSEVLWLLKKAEKALLEVGDG